jgi:hypothetical protein
VDPLVAARWLNAALFAANLLLAAGLIRRAAHRWPFASVFGVLILLASPAILALHVMAWSEPLFLFLGFLGLQFAAFWVGSGSRVALVSSAIVLGLTTLARYAGVAVLASAVLGVVLLRPGNLRRRISAGLALGVMGGIPILAWLVWTLSESGSATGRGLSFHPIGSLHVWQALDTAGSWLLAPEGASSLLKGVLALAALLILAAGLGVWWRRRRTSVATPPTTDEISAAALIIVTAVFIPTYLVVILVSITLFDANTPLDGRILAPVYMAALVLAVQFSQGSLARRSGRWAIGFLASLFVLIALTRSVPLVTGAFENGLGFNSVAWRTSQVLSEVRSLPVNTPMFSNSPEAIYLWTGRAAARLPRVYNLVDQMPNAAYATELAAMQRQLEEMNGAIVIFSAVRGSSMPSLGQLLQALPLSPVFEGSDGTSTHSPWPLRQVMDRHVVVPAYGGSLPGRAVQSALGQTYRELEVIVVMTVPRRHTRMWPMPSRSGAYLRQKTRAVGCSNTGIKSRGPY